MKDNYVAMKKGETVKTECTGTDKDMNYSAFKAAGDKNITVDLNHFCEYLPYGLDTKSKTFKDFSVAIKKEDTSSGRVMLTAVVVAKPTDEKMQMMRASRIASMIGSNGGVVRDDTKPNQATANVQGTQGIWNLDLKDFGLAEQPSGTVVAASMQSVATSSVGSEDVLYRVDTGYDEMNTMSTDLFMADHNIENVNNMIINGKNPNGDGNSLVVKNGKTSLAGDLAALANATVQKMMNIGYEVGKEPSDKALSVKGDTDITGETVIGGTLEVEKETTLKGNTTIGESEDKPADLTVYGQATVYKETTLKDKLTIEKNGADIAGDVIVKEGDVTISGELSALDGKFKVSEAEGVPTVDISEGNLNVTGDWEKGTGIIRASALDVDLLEADYGKFVDLFAGTSDAGNTEPDTFNLSVGTRYARFLTTNFAVGNVKVEKDASGKWFMNNTEISNPELVRLAVTNTETFMSNKDVAMLANDSALIRTGKSVIVATPDFRVKDRTDSGDGVELLRASLHPQNNENAGVQVSNSDFIVVGEANSKVFEINPLASQPADKASVRIRKGIMEIEPNSDKENPTGYVQLDRIVGNRDWDGNLLEDTENPTAVSGRYDKFQVNPAYTSVMHDIKLTTRGGARLSDILPDFINKGIYVLDNTYQEAGCPPNSKGETVCNWEEERTPVKDDKGNIIWKWVSGDPINIFNSSGPGFTDDHIAAADCASGDMSCVASPWLGYIPAPQCPPGYSKVATLAPIRFNMAQAGLVSKPPHLSSRAGKYDIWSPKNPAEQDYGSASSVDDIQNLTFQKSTWLNTSIKAHCWKNDWVDCGEHENTQYFQGWSGIVGFIYGGKVYEDLFYEVHKDTPNDYDFAWNLFPVYNQELTAVADVYCYFDRFSKGENAKFIETDLIDQDYDQMNNFRGPNTAGGRYYKPEAYIKRLNDPNLPYNDPW